MHLRTFAAAGVTGAAVDDQLPTTCKIGRKAGKKGVWFAIQADYDQAGGQWFWATQTTADRPNEADWADTQNLFGLGCISFAKPPAGSDVGANKDMQDCIFGDIGEKDFIMVLSYTQVMTGAGTRSDLTIEGPALTRRPFLLMALPQAHPPRQGRPRRHVRSASRPGSTASFIGAAPIPTVGRTTGAFPTIDTWSPRRAGCRTKSPPIDTGEEWTRLEGERGIWNGDSLVVRPSWTDAVPRRTNGPTRKGNAP